MRSVVILCMFLAIAASAHAARAKRDDRRTSAPVTLKGIGKQLPPPIVTSLTPIKKGQQPAETPAPTPVPEEKTVRRPAARPEARHQATPAEAAPPKPVVGSTETRVDRALADLIAQSPSVAARDKLRAYVAGHNKPEQIVPAMIRIGAISIELGDWAGAANTYEAAVKTATQPAEKAIAREGLIEALLHQNRLGDAVAAWNSLATENPTHVLSPATQIDVGMMLAMLGKPADARKMWGQMERTLQTMTDTQAAPLRARLALARALADELEGRVDQARAGYQDLAQHQPRTESGILAQARIADIGRPLISTAPATAAKP